MEMEKEVREGIEGGAAADAPVSRFEAFRAMGEDKLGEVLDMLDNRYGGLRQAILACEYTDEVAREVESWFCPEPDGCEDPSRYCGVCIEAWLNAPYDPADPLGQKEK